MSDYTKILIEQAEKTAEKVGVEFDLKLSQYCKTAFGSEDYYRYLKKHVTKEIITVTNKNAWTDPFIHACSPYIKAVPLIRDPYSFSSLLNDRRFPVFSRTLNDLTMLIKRLQQTNAPEIIVQDFGLFLYVMFSHHINHLQTDQNMTYEQAVYSIQQVILQFLCNISALKELNQPKVTLVMHDSLGMFQFLRQWNVVEHQQRMRHEPYYAEWDPHKIASFYSVLCPMLRDREISNKGFHSPLIVFKRTEFLPKLDRLFLDLYFNKYSEKRSYQNDGYFLDVLTSRNKLKYDQFAERNFTWEDRRKLYLLSRKWRRCFLNEPYTEPVIEVWKNKLNRFGGVFKFECYDPFEVDLTASQIFANTVLDFSKLAEEYPNLTRSKLREVYLMAQTINQVRRKYYSTDGDSMFMSLNVDVVNVPEEKREVVQETLAQITDNLIDTHMDNFTFVIHEDFTGFTEYLKQSSWYNKDKDNENNGDDDKC